MPSGRSNRFGDACWSPVRITEPVGAVVAVAAGFTAFAAARGDRRIVAYLLVVAVLAAGVRILHRAAPLPRRLQWALAAGATLHLAGGLVPGRPVLYETWLVEGVVKYDQAVHFTISAIVTVVAHHALTRWLDPARTPAPAAALLAVVVANGFGAGNEAFEFLSALRFADAYVGGLDNAGWDLVFNAFGSLCAAVLAGASPRRILEGDLHGSVEDPLQDPAGVSTV
jgi:uncharacterized membrane protein YjdF